MHQWLNACVKIRQRPARVRVRTSSFKPHITGHFNACSGKLQSTSSLLLLARLDRKKGFIYANLTKYKLELALCAYTSEAMLPIFITS